MPFYDFYCTACECPEQNITKEILCKFEDKPRCKVCDYELVRQVSAPKGYVIGTINPVRHGRAR